MRPIISKALSGAVFLTICAALTAHSASPATDSLQTALSGARTADEREQIYVQLADLSADSFETAVSFWEKALAEAREAGDDYGCREALDRLVQNLASRSPNGPWNMSAWPTASFPNPATPCSAHRSTPAGSGNR